MCFQIGPSWCLKWLLFLLRYPSIFCLYIIWPWVRWILYYCLYEFITGIHTESHAFNFLRFLFLCLLSNICSCYRSQFSIGLLLYVLSLLLIRMRMLTLVSIPELLVELGCAFLGFLCILTYRPFGRFSQIYHLKLLTICSEKSWVLRWTPKVSLFKQYLPKGVQM